MSRAKKKINVLNGILLFLGAFTLMGIGYLLITQKIKASTMVNTASPRNPDGIPRILFIGSSSTDYAYSYADQLKEMWPEIEITKIAMVGATTTWMVMEALPEIDTAQYDAVVIFAGLNDIYATGDVAQAESNLTTLYNHVIDAGSILVAITLQPTFSYNLYDDIKGAKTLELNNWIINNADVDIVIDLYPMLLTPTGTQNTLLYQPDMLHLNTDAHALLAAEIDKALLI